MRTILTIVAMMFLLISCQEKKVTPIVQNDSKSDSLQQIIDSKDREINDMMSTLNNIQEGFRTISEAEGKIALIKDEESTDKTELIRENIRTISDAMERNKELIRKLRQQVRESSVRGDQLKATIETMMKQLEDKDSQLQKLQAELQEKDIHIAELDQTVTNLNNDINSLKEESADKTETISAQDKQINTAWYAFGTKKELQRQNIYEDGRVLQKAFNKNFFTKIDIRVETEIKLYSKYAKIMTAHPTSSYSLVQDQNKQYILRINNPQSFWSASKYLVVIVK